MSKQLIKLKCDGQIVKVDIGERSLQKNEQILIESEQGVEVGFAVPECVGKNLEQNGMELRSKDGKEIAYTFIRKISDTDKKQIKKLSQDAKTYLLECQQKVEKFKLPMQLLDADLSFDEKKLTIYFTAPGRVDFRLLVSDLAHTFKKMIRLQQIGSRDEARFLGGVGRCGEFLCCKRFLKDNLESVTLDMAQDQNLAQMGSNRITGSCGKLMCCLKFELEHYREMKKKMPKIGSDAKTEDGVGVVIGHNVPKKIYLVRLKEKDNVVEVPCSN